MYILFPGTPGATGEPARTGETPDVGDLLDAVRAEHLYQLVERSDRVPDRENRPRGHN